MRQTRLFPYEEKIKPKIIPEYKMKVLDLFSGLGGWSKAFKKRGHEVITIDIEPKFNPYHIQDILSLKEKDMDGYDLIMASPPCECFSVMRIGQNWTKDNRPRTKEAEFALKLALHTFKLIIPHAFILENPRAKLRVLAPIPPTVTIWYCQYGERIAKPTDIWTNQPFKFRPECHNGATDHEQAPRGSNEGGTMAKDKLPEERALIPYELSLDICIQMENLFKGH